MSIESDIKKNNDSEMKNNDPDVLFCRSLISQFKALPRKDNIQANINFMQVILESQT